jgi:hypothetical protein
MLDFLKRNKWWSVGVGAAVVALVVVIAVVAASGGSSKATKAAVKRKAAAAKRAAVVKQARPAPLTGLPDKSGAWIERPAVTVKINNTDAAKQYGVDQADVVYEEVVEGGYTRLAAIFNSHAPDRVGPVRSVRRTDQSIVWPIGGIFAYSGGAQYAIDSINTAPVTQLDESRAGSMMFRAVGTEYHDPIAYTEAPMNLWARVDQMYKVAAKPVPPPALFSYRKAGVKPAGAPVKFFVVHFAGRFGITWAWDAKSGRWLRSKFGGPDIDAEGVQLAPKNVVVMFVNYAGGAGTEGAEAVLTGSGDAWVFTGGREIKGHWSRPDKAKPAKLTDASGNEIRLTPGQTWVDLPDVSYPVTVAP